MAKLCDARTKLPVVDEMMLPLTALDCELPGNQKVHIINFCLRVPAMEV